MSEKEQQAKSNGESSRGVRRFLISGTSAEVPRPKKDEKNLHRLRERSVLYPIGANRSGDTSD